MGVRTFIETKQYKRFAEFCDTCRANRYIGICHGPPGVGKTLSARHYALWDEIETLPSQSQYDYVVADRLLEARCVYYCPSVLNSARAVERDINQARARLRLTATRTTEEAERLVAKFGEPGSYGDTPKLAIERPTWWRHDNLPVKPTIDEVLKEAVRRIEGPRDPTELLLVDEADWLKIPSLEHLRSIFDEGAVGLVLIGMPGLEKRLSRYPQLYSRVGFVHAFTPLSHEEMSELFKSQLRSQDLGLPEGALDDKEALAAIIRATGGNFRLLQRLLTQVRRLMEINERQTADSEIVEAARQQLVIGIE